MAILFDIFMFISWFELHQVAHQYLRDLLLLTSLVRHVLIQVFIFLFQSKYYLRQESFGIEILHEFIKIEFFRNFYWFVFIFIEKSFNIQEVFILEKISYFIWVLYVFHDTEIFLPLLEQINQFFGQILVWLFILGLINPSIQQALNVLPLCLVYVKANTQWLYSSLSLCDSCPVWFLLGHTTRNCLHNSLSK